jgi:hypothetical protein
MERLRQAEGDWRTDEDVALAAEVLVAKAGTAPSRAGRRVRQVQWCEHNFRRPDTQALLNVVLALMRRGGVTCNMQPCPNKWAPPLKHLFHVKPTGEALMGDGVFAKHQIKEGTVLCDYKVAQLMTLEVLP